MKKLLLAFLLSIVASTNVFALGKLQGFAERGGQQVSVSGFLSTTKVQKSYPAAAITVFNSGTIVTSTIYANSAGTIAKSNPFTSDTFSNWFFFAADGDYDVRISPVDGTTPWTISGLRIASVTNTVATCPPAPTDSSACFQGLLDAISSDGAVQVPAIEGGHYFLASPLVIKKSRVNLTGVGQRTPYLEFDLSAYSGPQPKYGIILGDGINDPVALDGYEGNSIRDLRLTVASGTGGILAQRAPFTSIENVGVFSSGSNIPYGIRLIGSDDRISISRCIIGSGGIALAPDVAISVENGSNQVNISECTLYGVTSSIQVFNSVNTSIVNNKDIGTWVVITGTYYGVRFRTDQAVPGWLTWLPANAMADSYVVNNVFEPGNAAGATIYDIYAGQGTPSAHAMVGAVFQDNYFVGTTNPTRYNNYIDYCDQCIVRGGVVQGLVTAFSHTTTHASNTTLDIPQISTFDNVIGSIIEDFGTRTSTPGRFIIPPFNAGIFTANVGTWTVQSGDVLTYEYSLNTNKLTLIVYIVTTDLSSTPTALNIQLPPGLTIKNYSLVLPTVQNSGGTPSCYVRATAGSSVIQVVKADSTNFNSDIGGTGVQFTLTVDVTP